MSNPDRNKIVELLERLGGPDDEQVLRAARELHALVQESDSAWDDLLARDPLAHDPDEPERAPAPPVDLGDATAQTLIDRLLAQADLSDLTRDELAGYKNDIAEGEFSDDDRRYLLALEARL